jgi:hypothetical protein
VAREPDVEVWADDVTALRPTQTRILEAQEQQVRTRFEKPISENCGRIEVLCAASC